MNATLEILLRGAAYVALVWLTLLRWMPGVRRTLGRPLAGTAIGGMAALLLLVPVGGRPLWQWVFCAWTNPSVPMVGLLLLAVWQRQFGVRVFTPADWRQVWLFGAALGAILYAHAFWVKAPDLYHWGWRREYTTWAIAAVAVAFLCRGSRVGVLFVLALAAYAMGALESHNAWDYVIDPIYWLVSSGVLLAQTVLNRNSRTAWTAKWKTAVRTWATPRPPGASEAESAPGVLVAEQVSPIPVGERSD